MSLITSGFGHDSTASDVMAGIDLSGRNAIVTGGSSGIGAETVRALARAGASVTIAVRNTERGEQAASEIRRATGNADVGVAHLDLADRTSVASFARAWDEPLHLLVNNAGVMALQELTRTPEGWELQFATNHLGHFALALGLHDALREGGSARIVSVSSSGHHVSPVVFDDIHFEQRPYESWSAYGQAKTANVLFAVEASRRWAADGITANALTPGGVWSRLQQHVDQQTRDAWADAERRGLIHHMKTPEQGAATPLFVATSPLLRGIGGRYFEDCAEARTIAADEISRTGVRAWALDPDAARQLWDTSLALLETPQHAHA